MINLREVMSMTERKVLFTASTYSHIRSFHLPYLAEFARLGWTVDVACGGAPMELPGARRVIPVPFEKSMTSPKNLSAARLLRREIRREGYELVSCHTALASFFTRLAVKGMGHRPLVACTAHGYLFDGDTPAPKRTVLLGAERLCAPVTDLLMTMNAWDDHLAREKRLGRRIVNIPGMGVDFARMSALPQGAGEALRGEYGLAGSTSCWCTPPSSPRGRTRPCCCVPCPPCRSRCACSSPGTGFCGPPAWSWPAPWGWRSGWSFPATWGTCPGGMPRRTPPSPPAGARGCPFT